MFCQNCGAQVEDDSKFCESCGSRLAVNENINNEDDNVIDVENNEQEITIRPKKSGFAIAGFVLGLVSLFINVYVGAACAVLGLVFSVLGKKAVKTKNLRGKGLATAVLVLSIITLSFSLFDILLLL